MSVSWWRSIRPHRWTARQRSSKRHQPEALGKGHLGVGADADIVVLDPEAVTDNATFLDPTRTSSGVHQLLVGGAFVVQDGELLLDAFPGRPVRGAAY